MQRDHWYVQHFTEEDLAALRRDSTEVDLPEWILGGRPQDAGGFAGWDMRRGPTNWQIRNSESVDGIRPGLLRASRLGTPIDPRNVVAYRRLLNLSQYDGLAIPQSWDSAVAIHEQIAAQFPDELVSALTSYRTLIAGAAKAADLPQIAAKVMGEWVAEADLPNASLHFIEVNQVLGNRYGMARALLQRTRPVPSPKATAFASSLDLMSDILVGLSAYLEPLVTCLSPRVWGVTAPRAGGVIILSLGQTIRGRRRLPADVISMSQRGGGPKDLPLDEGVSSDAYRQTINWWVCRLDLVFSHLTDPSNYQVDGLYDAPSALERQLNFEQICRSCQTVATIEDEHARRLSLFHVLDALQGLNRSLSWAKLTSPKDNRELLNKIRLRIPPDVQRIVLPRAEAAVDALEQLQEGFFLPSRLTENGLLRPDKDGVEVEVPLSTAASEWLHVIRNSTHGYDKTPTLKARALLAAHKGTIPARLADLAWLNLLRVLSFPELLRRCPR